MRDCLPMQDCFDGVQNKFFDQAYAYLMGFGDCFAQGFAER
jgi:hypothetical protein